MSGFLGHLVQRSLTPLAGVRPRPVSVYEANPPSPTPDASLAAAPEPERNTAAHDPFRTDLTPAPDAVSRNLAPLATAASPTDTKARRPAVETVPRPDPRSDLSEDRHRGEPQTLTKPEQRPGRAPTAAHAETRVRDPFAQPKAATRFDGEQALPAVEESGQRGVRTGNKRRRKPAPAQRPPDETPLHAASESDTADSTAALRAHRLRLRGKLAMQPDLKTSEARSEAPFSVREGFTAPADPARTLRGESPDRAAVAEPDAESGRRTVASPPDPLRSASRAAPSATPQAILAPRLPYIEPLAQPVQPGISNPAEPTVHVTIGRVEIRAVAAPAAQKRSTPSKPALSLNDYLQRRSGGHG